MKAKDAVMCACSLAFMAASFGGLYYVVEKTPQLKTKAGKTMTSPPLSEVPIGEQFSGALGQPTPQIPVR